MLAPTTSTPISSLVLHSVGIVSETAVPQPTIPVTHGSVDRNMRCSTPDLSCGAVWGELRGNLGNQREMHNFSIRNITYFTAGWHLPQSDKSRIKFGVRFLFPRNDSCDSVVSRHFPEVAFWQAKVSVAVAIALLLMFRFAARRGESVILQRGSKVEKEQTSREPINWHSSALQICTRVRRATKSGPGSLQVSRIMNFSHPPIHTNTTN